ncbi:MAG: GNAT family N-acetyltransferase [Pseudomonadota bacterium]
MTSPTIETERLLLRRWKAQDLQPYAALCADPEVMRWIGNGATQSAEHCATAIAGFEANWHDRGFGLFAVALRDTGRFIGFVGFMSPTFLPEVLPAVEIGWRLARGAWGRGLATEGAKAALRFGLEEIGLERVICIVQTGNLASEQIALKLGMRLERETVDPSCKRPLRVYETV